MAGPAYIARDYSGGVVEGVQITGELSSTATSFTIANTTGWVNAAGNPLGTVGPFTVVIDLNTPSIEKILCSSVNLSSGLVTVYNVGGFSGRGYDQTTAQSHVPGASPTGVQPCWSAVEAAEANAAAVYGPGGGGSLIGLAGNPIGKLYQTSAGTLPGTGWTQVTLGSMSYLHGGMGVSGSNFGLLVPTSGYYNVSAAIQYDTPTGSVATNLGIGIYQNGSLAIQGDQLVAVTGVGGAVVASGTMLCAASDAIYLFGYVSGASTPLHGTGSPVNIFLTAALASK